MGRIVKNFYRFKQASNSFPAHPRLSMVVKSAHPELVERVRAVNDLIKIFAYLCVALWIRRAHHEREGPRSTGQSKPLPLVMVKFKWKNTLDERFVSKYVIIR
ncbi:TPA: hypothetical protein DEG75_04340 [Candidatus Dependentiae bacterium]|nr:hypothetical protein [Candidatus Dependentiae bacterium]